MTRLISMSDTELDRLEVIAQVDAGQIRQSVAAERLGLSVRQVQRLVKRYRVEGPEGLASKQRGKPSNRRISEHVRRQALALIREHYEDFGPTLACEKLNERHDIRVSAETVRRWMIDGGLWIPRAARERRVHQPRRRRACRGELIQIDGCQHDWFEDRGPRCSLLVYVDDATSEIGELRFVRSESTFDYFEATKSYLRRHGRPVAFYSDRHSIFRKANKDDKEFGGDTQFGRVLRELNIDILCANTPQAKGRVERAHLTLQDRLVKELRLEGIDSIEEANQFASSFMADYNTRFGRTPQSEVDAHRSLRDEDELSGVFCWCEKRKLTKNLVVHYKRTMYLVEPGPATKPLAGKKIDVHEWEDGTIELWSDGTQLSFTRFDKRAPHVDSGRIVDNKRLGAVLSLCQDQQRERDALLLKDKKLTLREKDRIREQRKKSLP